MKFRPVGPQVHSQEAVVEHAVLAETAVVDEVLLLEVPDPLLLEAV